MYMYVHCCFNGKLQIIRSQDEKLLEAEVVETKIRADSNQQNEIVREVCDMIKRNASFIIQLLLFRIILSTPLECVIVL